MTDERENILDDSIDDGKTKSIKFLGIVATIVAFCWSLFQIAVAKWILIDATWIRAIHLAFGIFIVYITIPFLSNRKKKTGFLRHTTFIDVLMGLAASLAALYIIFDYEGIAARAGTPSNTDIIVGVALILLLLDATRRAIGPALPIIVSIFMVYAFMGPYMPGMLAFKGVSVSRFVSQITMDTEGIFGVPLQVSATIVFLFVLFGTMLEKAGGGEFFIKIALSLLGTFRGGAAKAAVLGSALTGMISGSSIANVVTTGTFTIPLMKRLGYTPEKAAAIEVASGTNGQITPPIMGAAAFIIAEYVNVPYIEVAKAAAVPAFAAYISLLWITHIEACKLGLVGLPKSELPPFWKTFKNGIYFLIPIVMLVYDLVILGRSPEGAIFKAIVVLAVIMLIHGPIKALMNKEPVIPAFIHAVKVLLASLSAGAKNMCGVALATASAGIIVGIVALGLGQQITAIVEAISGGNVFILVGITAFAGLILGMGLPTTANYIIMASLTAPIMVQAGANLTLFGENIAVPLLVCHLFCFYFGILADVTPPVGLASYAGAAIAKTSPITTGIQAFRYDIRTAILPFFFFFNTDLVLWKIDGLPLQLLIFVMACLGVMAFSSMAQGWLIYTKNNIIETILLAGATVILLFPALATQPLGIDFENRHLGYIVGLVLLASAILIQYIRTRGMDLGPAHGGIRPQVEKEI